MKKIPIWPDKENSIKSITFDLIVGFDEEGQPVYKHGKVNSKKEIEFVQKILEPLQPVPASISSVTMGRVLLKLSDGLLITIRPVFHPSLNIYKDLFKVENFDCTMPDLFADMLNQWRQNLLDEL